MFGTLDVSRVTLTVVIAKKLFNHRKRRLFDVLQLLQKTAPRELTLREIQEEIGYRRGSDYLRKTLTLLAETGLVREHSKRPKTFSAAGRELVIDLDGRGG